MPKNLSSLTVLHLCPNVGLVLFGRFVVIMVFNLQVNWAGPTPPLQSSRAMTHNPPSPMCRNICEYEAFFHRAKCDKRDLSQVPLPSGCEEAVLLELQVNYITHVHEDNFSGYDKVKTLDLSTNQISYLQPGLFIKMSEMKNVIVSYNRLTEIPNGTFSGTERNLLRLYLNGNQISEISEEAFRGLHQVKHMSLSYNLLKALPLTVFHDLANLKHLLLDSNELTSLPEGLFTGLDSLCKVDLSHNNLVSIPPPESLGLVGPLQELNIEANNMTKSHSLLPYLDIANRIHIAENRFFLDCDFVKVCLWYFNKSETELSQSDLEIPLQCVECITEDIPRRCESKTTESYPTEYESSYTTATFLSTLNVPAKKFLDFDTELTICTSEIYQLVGEIRNILVYCAIIVTLVFTLLIAKTVCLFFKLRLCWKGQENWAVSRSV